MTPLPTSLQESLRIKACGFLRDSSRVAGIALGVSGLLLLGYAIGHTSNTPRCMEDEVYAVQIDTNPAHGLTWACENVEEFNARQSR